MIAGKVYSPIPSLVQYLSEPSKLYKLVQLFYSVLGTSVSISPRNAIPSSKLDSAQIDDVIEGIMSIPIDISVLSDLLQSVHFYGLGIMTELQSVRMFEKQQLLKPIIYSTLTFSSSASALNSLSWLIALPIPRIVVLQQFARCIMEATTCQEEGYDEAVCPFISDHEEIITSLIQQSEGDPQLPVIVEDAIKDLLLFWLHYADAMKVL